MHAGLHDSRAFLAFLITVGVAALFIPSSHAADPAEEGNGVLLDPPARSAPRPPKPASEKVKSKTAAKSATNSVPTTRPPDRERGRELWLQSCWQCHGEEGKGDGPASAALPGGVPSLAGKVQDSEFDRLVGVIENGRGPMPAYVEDIDKHDARRILVYLQDALQGKTEAHSDKKEGDDDDAGGN